MAGDWIKMRTDLYRDPKVCRMAELIGEDDGELARYVSQNCQRDLTVTRNVTRNAVVGALVTVWGVTRHRGKRNDDDLVVRHMTLVTVDDIADLPGFGEAMAEVGWVKQTRDGLVFPNFFEEFNVEPDLDQKAKAAERQRRFRERRNALRNAPVAQQSNDREEKRREEKSKAEGIPAKPETAPSEQAPEPPKAEPEPKPKREPKPKPKPKPRERDPLFDSVARGAGVDPSTAGPRIAKVCKTLRSAETPYTDADVDRFVREFHTHCPWAANNGRTLPELGEIEKYIGRIRSPRPPAPSRNGRWHGEPNRWAGFNQRSIVAGADPTEATPAATVGDANGTPGQNADTPRTEDVPF